MFLMMTTMVLLLFSSFLAMFMHIFGKSDQNMVVIVSNKTRLTEQQSRRVASHLWRMKRHLKLKDLLFITGYTTNVRTQLLGANTKSSEHRSNTSESESEYIFISCHVGPLHPLVFAP